jgi:predicted RNA binding protein YcfA (HicA-like mRNA interferase family)
VTKVPELSHQRIVRALERAGFVLRRQGKHLSMYHPDKNVVAIIPRHDPVKRSTLAHILKEIDMTVDEFVSLV